MLSRMLLLCLALGYGPLCGHEVTESIEQSRQRVSWNAETYNVVNYLGINGGFNGLKLEFAYPDAAGRSEADTHTKLAELPLAYHNEFRLFYEPFRHAQHVWLTIYHAADKASWKLLVVKIVDEQKFSIILSKQYPEAVRVVKKGDALVVFGVQSEQVIDRLRVPTKAGP